MTSIHNSLPPRQSSGTVALDLEIFQMNMRKPTRPTGTLACLTVCPNGRDVYFVTRESQIEKALARVRGATWVFHNAVFDLRHLRRWAEVAPIKTVWDTLLIERLLWSGYYQDFGLDDLSRRYLSKRLNKQTRKEFSERTELDSKLTAYAANDAVATWRVQQAQEKFCRADPAILKVWNDIDLPALWAILDFKGFRLNVRKWRALAREAEARYEEICAQLKFNPSSPLQVRAALLKKGLNLVSTAEEFLVPYQESIPLVAKILEARGAKKMAGTYGLNVIQNGLEEDGRLYTGFEVTGAKTGRMSSSDPLNLQNIPRDPRYRECFEAAPGNVLVIADYAQQEPRLTAQLSDDAELKRAFAEGLDVHQFVADAIHKDRKLGKAINLGLTYGLTAYGLAEKTGLPEHEADQLLTRYFDRFSGVKRWMDSTRAEGRKNEIVRTLSGRRMWLNLYSRQWLNHAVNAPVQGSAADVTKLALKYFHRASRESYLPIVAVVHDELVAEVPREFSKDWSKLLQNSMERAFHDLAPDVSARNLAEIHVGKHWGIKG